MSAGDFTATPHWVRAGRDRKSLVKRWIELVGRLQALDPVFADWYYWLKKDAALVRPCDFQAK